MGAGLRGRRDRRCASRAPGSALVRRRRERLWGVLVGVGVLFPVLRRLAPLQLNGLGALSRGAFGCRAFRSEQFGRLPVCRLLDRRFLRIGGGAARYRLEGLAHVGYFAKEPAPLGV